MQAEQHGAAQGDDVEHAEVRRDRPGGQAGQQVTDAAELAVQRGEAETEQRADHRQPAAERDRAQARRPPAAQDRPRQRDRKHGKGERSDEHGGAVPLRGGV